MADFNPSAKLRIDGEQSRTINKCGLLVFDEKKQILLVRKREGDTTTQLILPGGQYEPGEDDLSCLRREIKKELSTEMVEPIDFIGEFEDVAAADDLYDEKTVSIRLYTAGLVSTPEASNEIAEVVWYAPGWDDDDELSPILRNKIIPFLMEHDYFS
ncbi:MAG: hypothetical protein A2806_01875 [Candidatus Terrybacteria bacterium RIFCSPHIGHO2_01_FULL_48_17]|uniref:Nudix hydrolase domain-containing protein n=1 Tax=Candidatus Terrybacteria bacterium RIFCSPHIGHO2_01_FULL_48_17 TaxID=1802362 RepID=A0A1G2PL40_9BACT|nr:MAG: hypothetical protein A2806_01875 [Candidatus Terrybacteria bacterium RIFCSPHIGHO2_01_FULL_48_17]OHA52649.1 MAG: hypothetical protein A3A30_03420 [Candidatus Terrybacteria bacterium RIFCSPLOWO2_01_FULL_48_14]